MKGLTFSLVVTLFAFAAVDHVHPLITLTSNLTSLVGEVCPETIQFTCVATNFETTLIWAFGDIASATFRYVFDPAHRFPRTLMRDNVTVVILSATQNQQNMDRANFTSTLTASLSTLRQLNVQRIVCGSALNSEALPLLMSDVTVRVPPPLPVFTCSLADDGENVTFYWNNSYNSANAVDRYCLTNTTCSTCDISPSAPFVCNELQIGEQYIFGLRAINCGDQDGSTETVVIDLQGIPQPPRNVEVISSYNSSALFQIEVQWVLNENAKFSNKCGHKVTDYLVTLENDILASPIKQEVNSLSDSCDDSKCSTTINISQPRGRYKVLVDEVTIVGSNSTTLTSLIPASADSLLQPSFEFVNCITYATCSSPSVGTEECVISYNSISGTETVTGTLNDRFPLPLLDPNTAYRFLTNLTFNSSFTVEVHTTFITGDFEPKLTGSNIGMIVAGVIIVIVAIICVAVIVPRMMCFVNDYSCSCLTYKKLGNKNTQDEGTEFKLSTRNRKMWMFFLVVFYVVDVVSIAVTLLLWICIGALVGKQENTCDVLWQQSRDNLTTTSLVFSILSLLISLAGVVVILPFFKRKVENRSSGQEVRAQHHEDEKAFVAETKKETTDKKEKTTNTNNDEFRQPNPSGVQIGAPPHQ